MVAALEAEAITRLRAGASCRGSDLDGRSALTSMNSIRLSTSDSRLGGLAERPRCSRSPRSKKRLVSCQHHERSRLVKRGQSIGHSERLSALSRRQPRSTRLV